ncbi:MAG: malonate transporter subunit MadL [Cyclobacteriaceae bacterium]|nr:malonate transporter subunit MadL [Cyclobacteriaceae bacterium]
MTIYGVAILAFCFLTGKLLGLMLGGLIGINGDVGGVGFAMFFLVVANGFLKKTGKMSNETQGGIQFWGNMYIPIVVAMAASLNVNAALSGGLLAVLAGTGVTVLGFLLVPVLSKIGRDNTLE